MELNITEAFELDCRDAEQLSEHYPTIKLRFSLKVTILVYTIYLLPFCFGVFGNISVCLIFFQQKKLRSITNTFLMNLCLNDLIVLCVSIPMTLSSALLQDWVFGEFLCKFLNFAPTLTALVSTFTVATIAVERWFFIVNKRKFDRRCTIFTLILLWGVSIVIALPEFLSRYLQEFAPPMRYTTMKHDPSIEEMTSHYESAMAAASKPSCSMKKIYFCVFNPGLRMRLFSYIVITVQYLVPFLFVSISCYSISRFLKGRMKQMRIYQTHRPASHHPVKKRDPPVKEKRQKSRANDLTEHELTSSDELPTAVIINQNTSTTEAKPVPAECTTEFEYQNSAVIARPKYRSSSAVVGAVLIPTEKSQSHSKRRFHRSRKLLICVAALFTISWLPLTVVQIFLEHNEEITQNDPNFVYAFLLIPCYLISSLSAWMNPVIYNYINRSFRREFYALYPCCCKSASSSSSSGNPTRNELTSMVGKRSARQDMRRTVEDPSILVAQAPNRSAARSVTFANGSTNGKSSLVLFNEQT